MDRFGEIFGRVLEGFGAFLGVVWKSSKACFDIRFVAPRSLLHNGLIHAVTTLFHLLALFVRPFWCDGLCAAHGILGGAVTISACF